MSGFPAIAIDSETHLFANGAQAPKVVCVQWDDGEDREVLTGAQIRRFVKTQLELAAQEGRVIVGQNIAFDMSVFASASPDLLGLIFQAYDRGVVQCTTIRERLLDLAQGKPRSKYSLDELAERYGAKVVDKSNPWRLRYSELEDIPVKDWPPEALEYALDDPTATRQVWEGQNARAAKMPYDGFQEEAARQTSYDFALNLMRCWGVRTNEQRVKNLLLRTEAKLSDMVPELVKAEIMSTKGSKIMANIKARVEAAFRAEETPIPTTPTGATKTDKATLKKCHDPALAMVVEHSYLTKLKNTYIKKMVEGILGNIHASFHTLGADTGRTSSSGPNLQNQSTKGGVRECFVPREGFDFVGADYDSQELRTLAQACKDLCGYSNLANKFQEDPEFDPHTAFAATLMGWTYEDAMRRKAAGDPEVKERRQQAKAANFGFPGGLGAKNFMGYARGYGVDINEDQAKQLRDQWFEQWPEMKDYFRHAKWVADSGKLVQLRSKRIRGGVGFCDGANSYFQGLASEASKTAAYLISKACYAVPCSPLFGCRPVMLVHDEIIIEAPSSYSHEAAMELKRLMELAMTMWCPDVPARATPVVSRCWSKDAEPVWVDGRLVPWDVGSEQEEERAA